METLRLGIAMAGLDAERLGVVRPGADVARGLVEWAKGAGFAAVQLNAAAPGIRPRDLDRSGRRDLAAYLRRSGMACAGLDLWIPPEHFTDAAQMDRAVAAVLAAVEMARELAGLAGDGKGFGAGKSPGTALCLTLPAGVTADVVSAIAAQAARCGVRVADHAWPVVEREGMEETPWVGVGIDPATVLGAGEDPAGLAARLGKRVAAARVSDVAAAGATAGRVAPGSGLGRLDVMAYAASLAVGGYDGWAVLDLRGVPEQARGAEVAREAWGGAGMQG